MVNLTAMEIIKILGALAGVITGITALVKTLGSLKEARAAKAEAEAIVQARKKTAEQRDNQVEQLNTKIEVLKNEVKNHNRRLNEGTEKFATLEGEIKETNGLLREILGAIKIKFNLPIDGNSSL